jgi:hypothetical protein
MAGSHQIPFHQAMLNKTACLLLVLSVVLSKCGSREDPDRKEWINLFNGVDMKDWKPKIRHYDLMENFGNTFRVEDSVLRVSYDQYDSFRMRYGHIFYKDKFSYYLINVEYRFTGNQATGGEGWARRNSGIMVHGQSPESMLRDQDFPISIEVQLLGGLGEGERSTLNLCTPGTNVFMHDSLMTDHCVNSTSKTYNGDQWVNVSVLVLGDSLIAHIIDGDTVLQYSKPQIGGGVVSGYDSAQKIDGTPLTEGYISLQSESHPVEFRKVRLLNLKGCKDRKAKNFKSYYVAADNSACEYK